MLSVESLGVSYGKVTALADVSLEVREDEIHALMGANGAGKTTLLRAISGLIAPARGRIVFRGQELTRLPPWAIVGLGVCQVPEGRQIIGSLSVLDNLLLGTYRRRPRGRQEVSADLDEVFALFPRLRERRQQEGRSLSGGEQQMLAIGRALMGRPRLLLLDEPSLGLAPALVREVLGAIRTLHARGIPVLLVEQNARAALDVAHRATVLELGRVVVAGDSRTLAGDERIQAAYLGRRAG